MPTRLHLMGVIGTHVGKYELAVNFISQAIRLQGKHPAFHVNLSDALQRWGRNTDALAAARQAVRLDPAYAEGHNSVGSVCKSLGRLDEALAAFTRAIDLKGDYVDAHYNRSMLRICMGDFERGWDEYEWRWKRPNFQSAAVAEAALGRLAAGRPHAAGAMRAGIWRHVSFHSLRQAHAGPGRSGVGGSAASAGALC